jgi:two-component system, chemotaxis family, chemotaxis protein CheY
VPRDVRNVLVVDDYSTMRRIMRNLLVQIGITHVDEAEDGASALKKLHEKRFDLIISDWNMTPMSGLDLLREIRADKGLCHMPFIMVTAANDSKDVMTAKEAGVDNYIIKPFTAETLRKKIDTILSAA